MGITRIANITGLDHIGIPVVMVCRPNARSLSVSQGKGVHLPAARASGVMESIEAYHAESITSPLRYCTFEELRYENAVVDIPRLPKLRGSLFHPNLKILWIEGRDLLTDQAVWVPHELVHTDFTLPLPSGSGCFPLTSNGLASGNHILEATCHAICELVERDATALWNILGTEEKRKTRLDLESIDDPQCLQLLEAFEKAKVAVGVWETTSDIGIPAFLCTIIDRETDRIQPLYATSGMGCHPSRQIALIRALTEAAQSRLTFIAGSRDDTGRAGYRSSMSLDTINRFQEEVVLQQKSYRDFRGIKPWLGDTFNDDLDMMLRNLASAGMEQVIVVNLTKRVFNIPVVRVVIPGLEGSSQAKGYCPGERAQQRLNT